MFKGTRVSRQNIPSLRIKMGYVIQEGGLFPHLTAYENVTLMAHYLMWDQQRISRRLQELTYLTRFPMMDSIASRCNCQAASASGSA